MIDSDVMMDSYKMSGVIGLITILLINTDVSQAQKGVPIPKPAYSKDLETDLRTELFTTNNYQVLQRPQKRVEVTVSLTLLTINELNIKDQSLSISGYLSLVWFDSRLVWFNPSTTSQDYSNVPFLFSSETYVWRPAIIIENAIDNIAVLSDANIPMRIDNRGKITWNPAGIYKVHCDSDIKFYPLDKQTCTIVVSSWGYTAFETLLVFKQDSISLEFYSENGEWEMTGTSADRSISKARDGQSFSSLQFTITLRRRPLFHVLTTLFPVLLLAVLISMVFQLPPDSGEKIGFSLTVLLAYAVYLTLIAENIPSTSVTVCYLSIYLAFILTLGALSILCTIIVLKFHHRSESEEISPWVKALIWKFFARIICWKHYCCCCKRKVPKSSNTTEVKIFTMVTDRKLPLPNDDKASIIEEIEDDEECLDEYTWQEVALILDRLFFVIFLSVILLASLGYCLLIFIQYMYMVT